jgi:hypothetical protein
MSERQSPVLVHNRIEKNHRSTIILLAPVPLVLLPYAAGIAVWWAPMVALQAISYGPAAIAFLGLEMQPPWGELRLVLITAGSVLTIMTVVTLVAALLYRHAILARTGARLLAPDQEPDLQQLVESLCIGAGLPPPRVCPSIFDPSLGDILETSPSQERPRVLMDGWTCLVFALV